MNLEPMSPATDPPASGPRGGRLIAALVASGLVAVGGLMLIQAVGAARDAARRSQVT